MRPFQLALVSQEPVLFDATVAENIWLGRADRAAAASAAAAGGGGGGGGEWERASAAAVDALVKECQVFPVAMYNMI